MMFYVLEVVDCGEVPSLDNATITAWSPSNSTKYLAAVTYTCVPLMWVSRKVFSQTITCLPTGYWDTLSPCVGK